MTCQHPCVPREAANTRRMCVVQTSTSPRLIADQADCLARLLRWNQHHFGLAGERVLGKVRGSDRGAANRPSYGGDCGGRQAHG
jgi:hypothetical protein